MTPLPRWVLLALLLAVVDAQQAENACVCACRARSGIPRISEDCDHMLYLVSGSHGGAYLLARLLKLCLIPNTRASDPGHPIFVDAESCHYIRDNFIERYGCSCDASNNGKSAERKEEDQVTELNALKRLDMFKTREDVTAVPVDQRGWRSTDLPKEDLLIPVVDKQLDATDTTNAPEDGTDSKEDPIDWDMWCMTQCDNGLGGSACHCDIIP